MPASQLPASPNEPAEIGPFGPVSLRQLWHLVNAPRHIDGTAVRVTSASLLTFYVISSVIRTVPGHPEVWWLRGAVIVYALAGVVFGDRFTWRVLRAYTLGIALLVPAVTAAIAIVRGNPAADLAVTALAIFVLVVFLQTAVDILIAMAILAVASVAVLATAPPAGLPPEVAGIVVGGALISGGLVGMVLIAFRGRIGESTAWWQAACARERALREFTELAAPHLGDEMLAREFAARFRAAFGPGHCTIALVGADGGAARVAATVGMQARDAPSPAQVARLIAAVADRQPRVSPARELAAEADEGSGWRTDGDTLVLLPIVIDERVDGIVALVASQPRPIEAEDLLLWRAMANQVGAAVGSARLFARLQDALRARSEFVNTMSHELRSPLHVIIGYTDMLMEGREEVGFLAGRIRASALELLQLVENTLAVARLGTGRIRLELSEFDMPELIDELRESTRALPEAQHAVPVRWELADDLPRARLDRLKVKEVVHNLVSNALKFTERGTVTVRVGREGAQLRIDVEDTGAGIPPAGRERIFEMFERLEAVNGPRTAGVGLGLYIVRNLVQLMQGTVTLASELGQGSRFTVRLPLRL